MVNEVVAPEKLMDAAHALAQRIVEAAPIAVRAVKAVLQATETTSIEAGFALLQSREIPEYGQMLDSEDALEGPRAFAEKRAQSWKGQ